MAKRGTSDHDKILKDLGQFQITRDQAQFSELEESVLAAYDELEELRLERVLLETSIQTPRETLLEGEDLDAAIKQAERQVLDARAGYKLRNSIIENVLMVDPILKAVHSGSSGAADDIPNRSQLELKRLLNQRDVLGLTQTNIATSMHELRNELAKTQVETIRAVETNRELALEICQLAAGLKSSGPESVQDEELQEQLAESKRELALAKRSRTLLKHVVSGVIAGSGVDWSQDEELRALVLDEDT